MCCVADDMFLRKVDFDGTQVFLSKAMKGTRFRLIMDRHLILEHGVHYQCNPAGGFTLTGIEMGDDSVLVVQFY